MTANKTNEPTQNVKAKRVLVTGASGFIGKPLVAALLRTGYVVRVATRRSLSFPNPIDEVIIPDLANPVEWKPILRGIDIVVHLAGLAHTDESNLPFDEFDRINWIATLRLANAAKKARVKHFVYISSVRAQVGPFAAQIVRERDRPQPTDPYGRSKLAAEHAIRSVHLPFTVLRPVVVYGPHTRGNFGVLVRLASLPLPLPVKGLSARRSLLGIDNLVSAIIYLLITNAHWASHFWWRIRCRTHCLKSLRCGAKPRDAYRGWYMFPHSLFEAH
jgi:nucleoside-diphosphate-sugar epimerase